MKSISFLEKNGIDINKSLEVFGDVNTYNETIGEFLVGIHSKINKLITFMQNRDMNNYTIYVHSMKNDAQSFGFNKLADVAIEHEKHSKIGDVYYINSHINDLIKETNNAITLIQEYMNGEDSVESLNSNQKNPGTVYDKKTILVVDDSNIVRNFVKRIFSDKYNVGTAENGEEAINIIKDNMNNDNIMTILLDLNMPKVDGFAVLDFMKENNLFEKIPVSIISGDSSKETIDKAFTYKIIDMLSKPFNERSVKAVIDKILAYKDLI